MKRRTRDENHSSFGSFFHDATSLYTPPRAGWRREENCNNLTDEKIWDTLVYDFQLDELQHFGSNLDEAVRNALANDLPLERLDEGFEINEIWPLIAYEVGGCEVDTNL